MMLLKLLLESGVLVVLEEMVTPTIITMVAPVVTLKLLFLSLLVNNSKLLSEKEEDKVLTMVAMEVGQMVVMVLKVMLLAQVAEV